MPIIKVTADLKPREPNDHYPTPYPFAAAGLSLLPTGLAPQNILDPGAGAGVWGSAARQFFPNAKITGVEIRDVARPPVYDAWFTGLISGDFRYFMSDVCYDLVIGNPPYKYTEAILKTAFGVLRDGGYMVFLLPLQFLESRSRKRGLWRHHPPVSVTVCSNRPSWTGNRKTDATAYAYYLWRKGYKGQPVLDWMEV